LSSFDNLENTAGYRPEAIPGQMTRPVTDGALATQRYRRGCHRIEQETSPSRKQGTVLPVEIPSKFLVKACMIGKPAEEKEAYSAFRALLIGTQQPMSAAPGCFG
jgi:hypothetical protein